MRAADVPHLTMKIQLWSYNYSPEPTGIAPVSATFARAMATRGHEVQVIAAHPHYPQADWGSSWRPYKQTIDGIGVVRLPLLIGRGTAGQRIRQEASFAASQLLALPWLGKCDAMIAVSPCFPALGAAIVNKRIRKVPWVLWLQDILPDGAVSTGIVDDGAIIKASRRLEQAAYASADSIAVISANFKSNLLEKAVPEDKLKLIYNPATRPILEHPREQPSGAPRIVVIGNIGHSQGLPDVVTAFERSARLAELGARLIVTGAGVAEPDVRAAITTDRVEMLGLVSEDRLDQELAQASIGLVSQRSDIPEFNLPSKLMNYFANALPIVAAVGHDTEVAALVKSTGSGWIVDLNDRDALGATLESALSDLPTLAKHGEAGRQFAQQQLSADALATQFETLVSTIVR